MERHADELVRLGGEVPHAVRLLRVRPRVVGTAELPDGLVEEVFAAPLEGSLLCSQRQQKQQLKHHLSAATTQYEAETFANLPHPYRYLTSSMSYGLIRFRWPIFGAGFCLTCVGNTVLNSSYIRTCVSLPVAAYTQGLQTGGFRHDVSPRGQARLTFKPARFTGLCRYVVKLS